MFDRALRGSSRLSSGGTLFLAILVAVPAAAGPADPLSPYASVDLFDDSNVFGRPSDLPVFVSPGRAYFGDFVQKYTAGLDATTSWSQQQFSAHVEGSRENYDRFTQLDHNEYALGGLVNWSATSTVTGDAAYDQRQTMAPPQQTFSTNLLLDTERLAHATARILITPEWRLDLRPDYHELQSPLPGYLNFSDEEEGATATLNYIEVGGLVAGLQYNYTQGQFHGIVDATRYHQDTGGIVLNYQATERSSFNFKGGYTTRNSTLVDPSAAAASPGAISGLGGVVGRTSDATGALGYRYSLTAKTGFNLDLHRTVDSFGYGANPQIETGGALEVDWDPDALFTVRLKGSYDRVSIQGLIPIEGIVGRADVQQEESLKIVYHFERWMDITLHGDYLKRTSGFALANYSETIAGLSFKVFLPQ